MSFETEIVKIQHKLLKLRQFLVENEMDVDLNHSSSVNIYTDQYFVKALSTDLIKGSVTIEIRDRTDSDTLHKETVNLWEYIPLSHCVHGHLYRVICKGQLTTFHTAVYDESNKEFFTVAVSHGYLSPQIQVHIDQQGTIYPLEDLGLDEKSSPPSGYYLKGK